MAASCFCVCFFLNNLLDWEPNQPYFPWERWRRQKERKRSRKRRRGSELCLSWGTCIVFWELEGVSGHQKGAWLHPTIKKISNPLGRGPLSNSFQELSVKWITSLSNTEVQHFCSQLNDGLSLQVQHIHKCSWSTKGYSLVYFPCPLGF